MDTNQRKKIYTIQALRGIAAIFVVISHMGAYITHKYGIEFSKFVYGLAFSGVDFFFVLSGFIISYGSYTYVGKTEKFKTFYLKRIFRVLPVYWIIITPLAIMLFFMPALSNSKYTFTVSNILQTYFVFPLHPKLVGVSWTLSHELYFYTLFSLAIISRKLIIIPILILLVSIINCLIEPSYLSNYLLNFLFSPLNLEFSFGILAFYIYKNFSFNYSISMALLILGLVASVITYQFPDFAYDNRSIFFGIPSFFILLGIISLEKIDRIKTTNFMNKIGDASYMMYLIHYHLIALLNEIAIKLGLITKINPLLLNLLILITILLISIYVYKVLEKPILTFFNRLVSQPKEVIANNRNKALSR